MLSGKHIVVGIGSGIAAYKIPELIRLLRRRGAEVKVTTTRHALEFVTDLTLQTLSGNKVYSDVFAAINDHSTEHISLPVWADAMIVAPATHDVICKYAAGIADDALTTTLAAMRKPVVIAPAMNDQMYAAEALQEALRTLAARENIDVLDCADGFLACGTNGRGRMQEPEALLEAIEASLTPKSWQGKKVIVTAGGTREAIDPVRFISNHSSGKMGIALAKALLHQGADVTLIMGATTEHWTPVLYHSAMQGTGSLTRVDVVSAQQMYEATTAAWQQADVAILAAAVADMTPATVADHKMKKGQDLTDSIALTETKDIARALGESKRPDQTLVGFALETDNEQQNALKKLQSKHLDFIVMNSLREAGAGFGTDTNSVTVYKQSAISDQQSAVRLPLASKQQIAEQILEVIQK
ncbi:MAG: bifunctional phosphopantothenoylcysteine decarboxylase/phosphopantothenate--cysteine ligase CoaBC [Paludibacteraceae bacterium]|nr:bifunctional phosphopantothenoylcysteine decarboxylase/phosphopantothenate--cysteine ligase CoaBC [Paludibacteraceae bacterium]